MPDKEPSKSAIRATDGVIRDLCDRRGLSGEYEAIDEDIQAEIRATWIRIIDEAFTRENPHGQG